MMKTLAILSAFGMLAFACNAQTPDDPMMGRTNNPTCPTNRVELTNCPPTFTNRMEMTNHIDFTNRPIYTNYIQFTNRFDFTNRPHWFTNTSGMTNGVPPKRGRQHQVVVPPMPPVQPPQRPTVTDGTTTPADVQAMVQKFQQDREAFIARQTALEQQLQTATTEQRQQIREQLRTQMEQFKQQQQGIREQITEQAKSMRDQLRDHGAIVDKVTTPATTPGQTTTRPRGRGGSR